MKSVLALHICFNGGHVMTCVVVLGLWCSMDKVAGSNGGDVSDVLYIPEWSTCTIMIVVVIIIVIVLIITIIIVFVLVIIIVVIIIINILVIVVAAAVVATAAALLSVSSAGLPRIAGDDECSPNCRMQRSSPCQR
jgi:hypothetical protein